jgi:hypothetical protein
VTRVVALVAALVLATAAAGASAGASPSQSFSLKLGGPHISIASVHWHPGSVRIAATSAKGEQELTLIRFRPGYSVAGFLADGKTIERGGRKGDAAYRRLMGRTEFLGGVDVFRGEPAAFAATVHAGVYYLAELNARPLFLRVDVGGARAATTRAAVPTIEEYDFGYRVVGGPLPARGTITVRNAGKLPHRLNFEPLQAGTTKAQVAAYLRSTGGGPYGPPPPFARRGPELGSALLGPGRTIQYTYAVPPGAYGLVSWQKDTPRGKPQALLGMVAVVTLR